MTIVFYISGHGLGHATREVAVINAVAARRRDVRFLLRTMAPRWLIEASASAPVEVQAVETDPGGAGVRSAAIGTFTWDWIYSLYPAFDRVAAGVIETISGGYARASHAL